MSAESLRIDRWLWCARFFKSRNLAAEAVRAGHVKLNGQRIKPARDIAPGDRLSIRKGDDELDVEVIAIPARRGPAVEAVRCYLESEASIAKREAARAARPVFVPAPTSGRPDKRTRRLMRERERDV
jgi:ribosome-associated heat shock protein Hsp15